MPTADHRLKTWLRSEASSSSPSGKNGHTYSGIEDLILDRGRSFVSKSLSDTKLAIVLAAAQRARESGADFAPQRCFANAAQLVICDRTGELSYVEGFTIGTVSPIHHAWAIVQGVVIDLTLRSHAPTVLLTHDLADRVLGTFEPNRAYIGISFSRAQVVARFADLAGSSPFFEAGPWVDSQLSLPRRATARSS